VAATVEACRSQRPGPSLPPELRAHFRLRIASSSSSRCSVLKFTRVFIKPSKALRSVHVPMVDRVTAAGIAVRAVFSSKRASDAVSDISGRIVANGVAVAIGTGVVHVSGSRSRRRRRRCRRATTTKPLFLFFFFLYLEIADLIGRGAAAKIPSVGI